MSKPVKMSSSALNTLINNIAKSAKSIKADANKACIASLSLCLEHGDVTHINKLCDVMKDVAASNAIPRWFTEYGKGVVSFDTKAKAFIVNKRGRKDLLEDDKACEVFINNLYDEDTTKPYYELTKASPYQPFILAKEVQKLIKKASNRAEIGDERDDVSKSDIDKLVNALKNIDQASAVETVTSLN